MSSFVPFILSLQQKLEYHLTKILTDTQKKIIRQGDHYSIANYSWSQDTDKNQTKASHIQAREIKRKNYQYLKSFNKFANTIKS